MDYQLHFKLPAVCNSHNSSYFPERAKKCILFSQSWATRTLPLSFQSTEVPHLWNHRKVNFNRSWDRWIEKISTAILWGKLQSITIKIPHVLSSVRVRSLSPISGRVRSHVTWDVSCVMLHLHFRRETETEGRSPVPAPPFPLLSFLPSSSLSLFCPHSLPPQLTAKFWPERSVVQSELVHRQTGRQRVRMIEWVLRRRRPKSSTRRGILIWCCIVLSLISTFISFLLSLSFFFCRLPFSPSFILVHTRPHHRGLSIIFFL